MNGLDLKQRLRLETGLVIAFIAPTPRPKTKIEEEEKHWRLQVLHSSMFTFWLNQQDFVQSGSNNQVIIISNRQVNVEWGLPAVVCDFYIAMDVTCSTSSIFNLVAISIDR